MWTSLHQFFYAVQVRATSDFTSNFFMLYIKFAPPLLWTEKKSICLLELLTELACGWRKKTTPRTNTAVRGAGGIGLPDVVQSSYCRVHVLVSSRRAAVYLRVLHGFWRKKSSLWSQLCAFCGIETNLNLQPNSSNDRNTEPATIEVHAGFLM